jgi:glycosyltransferase involved in cell wall biosynthesis
VIHAGHLLPGTRFALVGTGGREAWARLIDHRFASASFGEGAPTDRDLWLNTGRVPAAVPPPSATDTNIEFCGWVEDSTLDQLYRNAPCVVAPALDEDYGLTAIEAMRHGRPVIVCQDGGGLAELVDDGVHGLVVEPSGPAIAAAVERLVGDPDLADELGANGRVRAAELNWANADTELCAGLDRVLA